MKEKIMRFMYGRYGMDSLGKCLVIVGLIAMLTAGWTDSLVLVTLSWALIIYAYFRMFSRNVPQKTNGIWIKPINCVSSSPDRKT